VINLVFKLTNCSYIKNMKTTLTACAHVGARTGTRLRARHLSSLAIGLGLLMGFGFLATLPTRADDTALADNPYGGIPARNVFNLVPIPTNPPVEVKPPDPPSKITPDGIMSLFGQVQVLFKVAVPPKAGQPPQDQSYTMGEGDREDGIAVIKIDQAGQTITFDNHGVVQNIPLVAATSSGGGGGGPGPGFGGPGGMPPGFHGRFGPGGGMNFAGGYAPPPPPTSAPSSSAPGNSSGNPQGSGLSYEAAQAKLDSIANDPNTLTPEAQVIMIEANRQQLQAAGDPAAPLMPITDLTPK
jgi:hypothetical protein